MIIPLYNEWAAFHWIKLREELRDSGRWSMTSLNIQRRSLERLHIHFRLYIMFLLARNTFPFLEHNSSKRREPKPFQKQYWSNLKSKGDFLPRIRRSGWFFDEQEWRTLWDVAKRKKRIIEKYPILNTERSNFLCVTCVWFTSGGADALSKLVFVDVDPCINQPDPCSLKKGTEETIQVQFVPSTKSPSV